MVKDGESDMVRREAEGGKWRKEKEGTNFAS